MNAYESLEQFLRSGLYGQVDERGRAQWVVGNYLHIDDAAYRHQVMAGTDQLGFQPFLLTFINPYTRVQSKVMVKHVDDATRDSFLDSARNEFVRDYDARHGSFRPAETHAFAEYDSWESFYTVWLERHGQSTLDKHLPLLFDHVPAVEHWTRRQSGLETLPYQRLLLTTYFAPKEQFFDFFIKNVDDNEMDRIKLLVFSRLGLNLDRLYSKPLQTK